MSQSENKSKTKLSDVARQNNADKAKRFSSTMIPAPPLPKTSAQVVVEPAEPEPVSSVVEALASAQPSSESAVESPKTTRVTEPAPTPAKTTRTRRSGALTVDDVISGEPPKGEAYPRQVRISESHHKLLRKLSFLHDVTMNHVLYNLLDQLEQADQRDQQKAD